MIGIELGFEQKNIIVQRQLFGKKAEGVDDGDQHLLYREISTDRAVLNAVFNNSCILLRDAAA
ncbi:hypothetical protein D3C80_1989880 [compost metagenome]